MSIAFFPYGEPELEAYGIRLLNRVSALLRAADLDAPSLPFVPVGPDFDYEACPQLFRGRRGAVRYTSSGTQTC